MLTIETPAPFFAARDLIGRAASMKPIAGQCASYQLAVAPSFGIAIGGELLVVIGFFPLGDGVDELFMGSAPAAAIAPHMIGVQRAGRLICRQRLHSDGVGKIVAWVASANLPGKRLASAAGFVAVPGQSAPGVFQLWELRRGSSRQVRSGDEPDDR